MDSPTTPRAYFFDLTPDELKSLIVAPIELSGRYLGVIEIANENLTHALSLQRYRYRCNHGMMIRPPVIGVGTPVVPGNEIGSPR